MEPVAWKIERTANARNDSLQKVIFEAHFFMWSKVWFIRSRRPILKIQSPYMPMLLLKL